MAYGFKGTASDGLFKELFKSKGHDLMVGDDRKTIRIPVFRL